MPTVVYPYRNGQFVPYGEALGIAKPVPASKRPVEACAACALVVFVPFEISARLLEGIVQGCISPTGIWRWVREAGQRSMEQFDRQLEKLAQGEESCEESMESRLTTLPLLIIGVAAVMAPFGTDCGSSARMVDWREVNVGIFTRFGRRNAKAGKEVTCWKHRRVVAVAVLGPGGMLGVRMVSGAVRQGMHTAKRVVWISDSGT